MSTTHSRRVVVVMGGESNERDVSLATGEALAGALREAGVEVDALDLRGDGLRALVSDPPDAVVIALHGGLGEGGPLQGLLEYLGVPYTGSGVLASALALDKVRSKRVFESAGVPTPVWTVATSAATLPMPTPFVVKPSLEGSSVGISMVRDEAEWPSAFETCAACPGEVLVEGFVDGRELTVAIFDGEVMGIIEIAAAEGFYDYDAKYVRGDTTYRYPAPFSDATTEAAVAAVALAAYEAIGCRGVARVDVMLDRANRPWVLEANTVPGMTATSLVPKVAAGNGVPFPEFARRMLDAATTDALAERARKEGRR